VATDRKKNKKSFDGRAAARALPHAPGVYQMRDAAGALLYVGKARDLRKRVASYFSGGAKNAKTQLLLGKVADVQVTVTHTERDALLLENNLIKSEKPRYNVLLRDDKSYPYIHLDDTHRFPRLGFHRGERKPAGRFFGPWPGIGSAREALALLKKIFPVRQCEDSYFRNRKRPCLQYQIKRCSAPCVAYISAEDYAEDVRQAALFLEGKNQSLTEHLGRQMEQAAARMDYESAARYRDRVAMLKRMQQSQFMETAGGDADVLALAAKRGKVCAHFLLIRGGRNVGGKSLLFNERLNVAPEKMHETVLAQAYLGKTVPAEIILRPSFAGRDILQAELGRQAGRKVTIRCRPRSGGRRAAWLSMAELNAGQHLASHFHGRSEAARRVRALAEVLQLGDPPRRMECFDVSHTGGGATIASCVAFEDGAPRKSDYRSFTIADAPAGDDYAALEQALRRRYRRVLEEGGALPDLLLIDGGKGQLRAAQKVMEEFQLGALPIIGIAKGRARKAGRERLFLSGRRAAVILDAHSPALHLLQAVRDEAHRFAITAHRRRRSRNTLRSTLEDIPGIGEKRRQALLMHFGGLRELRQAAAEEIARAPGISRALAQKVHENLHA